MVRSEESQVFHIYSLHLYLILLCVFLWKGFAYQVGGQTHSVIHSLFHSFIHSLFEYLRVRCCANSHVTSSLLLMTTLLWLDDGDGDDNVCFNTENPGLKNSNNFLGSHMYREGSPTWNLGYLQWRAPSLNYDFLFPPVQSWPIHRPGK